MINFYWNKRAKLEKNEAILGEKEVILQPNLESIVLKETQKPESKTNFAVPAPENNFNSNNSIDHTSDVKKTDPVRANPESETIDLIPDESLQISPIQGECSKSEVESGQNKPVLNPELARFNNSIQTSQPSYQTFPAGALAQSLNGGQVCPSQMWHHNQHQLQQMYYCLQLQQQQLQQNQLQSNHSSPSNNLLQEKQQQLQQQMMYYQQMYQMYLQQSMQVQQQQQQHWYQFQQQQMALGNAPHSQDKEQVVSSHPSTPIK